MINNVLQDIQTERYIGIPYLVNGRDFTGIDCYGLVRLVYKEELGIDLPSFVEEGINPERTQELISQYKEGWEPTDSIKAGDVVIFRVMGVDAHIAVAVSSTHFLHARQGYSSAIESFSSGKWKTRLVGAYKYSPVKSVVLNGIPHPLRTERITTAIPAGTNIVQLEQWILKEYKIDDKLHPYVKVLVNGIPIPDAMKECTVIQDNDCVEYRVVAQGGGDSSFRMLLTIAVMVAAPQLAVSLAGTGALGATALAGSIMGVTTTGITLATIGITAVGMALVNAIAPVRLPSASSASDPGSAERQLIVTGGANRASPYGAIPFVLGKVRMTPTLGANTYSYFNPAGTESYLRMLLVWGYGPLYIDESTLKIGELPISSYAEVTQETLDRITEPTTEELTLFNNLYGTDVTQVVSNVELTCDGTAGVNTNASQLQSGGGTTEGTTATLLSGFVASSIRAWQVQYGGRNSGSTYEVPVSSIVGNVVTFTPYLASTPINYTYTYNITVPGVAPGPWITATSTDGSVGDFTVAVHFPQGCRRVASKGDSAGSSSPSPVEFELQYKAANAVTWTSYGEYIVGKTATKDAFTSIKLINPGIIGASQNVQVRIRRLTGTGNTAPEDTNYQWLFTSTLLSVTFSRNVTPAQDPINCKIAKTAFQIKASDQFNNQIEGVNAIVQTWGKSWNGSAWVDAAINNPAALFRHVLEHPANPRRVTDAASKINLVDLQHWHEYCTTKGFTYNSVVGSQRSVLDILRDICAAGRASPAMIDGKWTITIDEPKSNVVQHFTPHNSWGFEGTKALPRIPDGLRVNFINEDKDYQEDETIVYAAASSEGAAVLLESITVPGVTKLSLAQDHARWHMAQAKLRPETYSLNTDIEYIVCNRGDRVKVMHDVPMWGLGSGRIKNTDAINNRYYLDEDMPMQAGVSYSIRVRGKTGLSTIRTVVAKVADGYYNDITLTASATSDEIDSSDMFLFGELSQESQDCIVLAIEPMSNKSARITLTDYGVNDSVNIYTDYLNYTNNLAYESNISLPAVLNRTNFKIDDVPTVTNIISSNTAADRISPGVWQYNIAVSYFNPVSIPSTTELVECQYDISTAETTDGVRSLTAAFNKGSIYIPNVRENVVYKFRLRYINNAGASGPWSAWYTHAVAGLLDSSSVSLSLLVQRTTRYLRITPVLDTEYLPENFKGYEFRVYKDSGTGDFWEVVDEAILTTFGTGITSINLRDFTSPRLSQGGTKYRIASRVLSTTNTYISTTALAEVILTSLV